MLIIPIKDGENIDRALKRFKRNILFHSPRNSFMHAIKNNVFDDLLIGNFMKTYLSGIKNLNLRVNLILV